MSDGKGGGGSGVTTHDYYGTIAAVLRCGKTKTLHTLLVDGKLLWEGPISRTDPGVGNPYDLSITFSQYLLPGGYARLYWGGQTVADPALPGHPPYTDFTILVLHKFLFGRERTTAPNIEAILTAEPEPPAAVIPATALDADGQANLWAVIAELLTSIHGSALDPSRLDAASWHAVHDAFAGSSLGRTLAYCSPILSEQAEATQVISQLLALCDGWLRLKDDGTIEAGYYPVDPGDLSQYTKLDANDLTDPPQLNAEAWDSAPTGCVVNFVEGTDYFVNSSLKVDDLRALQQAVEPRRETLDLPFITRDAQARRIGAEWVKRKCQPQTSGQITVRMEKAVNPDDSPLRVGNRFLLDIDPEPGGDALLQLCRVTSRRRGQTGPVTLDFDVEVNQPAVPYTPVWTPPASEGLTVAPLTSARILPMPLTLTGKPEVCVLAQRGDDTTIGAHVLFDVEGGAGTFTTLGDQVGCAVPCQLAADYASDAAGAIRVTIMDTRDQHLALEQPGPSGAQNDELLLVIYHTDGDYIDENADGTPALEWFSIESSAVVAGDTYDFTALRGRLDSVASAWSTGDACWIIPRSSLTGYQHVNFPAYVTNGTDLVFRLSPFSKFAEFEGALPNLPFRFPSAWQRAPVITWTSPTIPSFELDSTGNLVPGATITDKDGNMVRVTLYFTRDDTGLQAKVFDVLLPPTASITLADCFTRAGVSSTLNFPGSVDDDTFYTLTIRAQDSVGNVVESSVSLMRAATGGGGSGLLPPQILPLDSPYVTATVRAILYAVATQIEYSITALGAPAPGRTVTKSWAWPMPAGTVYFETGGTPSSWPSLTGSGSGRLWARANNGSIWSTWVFKDYTA